MFGLAFPTFRDAHNVRRWTLALLAAGTLLAMALGHWMPAAQAPLAVALIMVIGLQHGALDHILHAHIHGDPEGPLRQSFVLPYVAGIGLCWAAFEWVPPLMLGVFLLVSAYHFGMSHLLIDAMRRNTAPSPLAGTVMGLVIIAPLVLRPDALAVLDTYGWDLSPGFSKRFLPLQLASGAGLFLAVFLHRQWGTGWLPLAGVVLAWAVDDLLLAFALYFALCHSREAFFEEFVERQSVARDFKALYVRSLPLTAVFTAMAGAVLWALSAGLIGERSALSFLLAGTLPHIAVLEGWVTARLR